jgi:hypothetical protein
VGSSQFPRLASQIGPEPNGPNGVWWQDYDSRLKEPAIMHLSPVGPIQGHRIAFSLHRSHWFALSPSSRPPLLASPFVSLARLTRLPWRWRQQIIAKRYQIWTLLYSVTTQKTNNLKPLWYRNFSVCCAWLCQTQNRRTPSLYSALRL